jgi:hypothetical protein
MSARNTALRFHAEWERSEGVAAPELAATWARLEIWADSTCITQVEDAEVGSARRGIHCSLYPLAEWVAFNWWLLKAHARPAALGPTSMAWSTQRGGTPPSWLRSHNLRGAGDGFIWPDLAVLPSGELTRLAWRADRDVALSKPIKYLVDGDTEVPSALVEHALSEFVESVVVRLGEQGVEASPLADEWQAVRETTGDEEQFCIAAARIGFDPYSVPTDVGRMLEEAGTELEEGLLADFLDAVDPASIDTELAWVQRTSSEIDELAAKPSAVVEELRKQARAIDPPGPALPWSRGFRQARRVRKILALAPTEPFSIDGLMTYGESVLDARGLQAIGGISADGGETLLTSRPFGAAAKRFAGARALWHFTHDTTPQRFLLTSAHGDRQRVARSFAAELLAPADGIRELLGEGSEMSSEEDIEQVAAAFGVSSLVVSHQIANQLVSA